MSAKHTPGPWEIRNSSTGYPYQIIARNGTTVRNVTRWAAFSVPSLPEGQANACLIAAAPELLEACRAALEKLTDIERYGEHHDNPLPTMLRAAIAKAEGR